MTNEEFLKHLTRKHFAELLIKTEQRPDYDEGLDGEWHYIGDQTFYITSDGQEFWEDYDSALEHECWWLAQDALDALIRTGVCNPDGTPKEQIVTEVHY